MKNHKHSKARATLASPLWLNALSFAARGHEQQFRKDGITPYIAHPARVALIARDIFGIRQEEALAAAALHDVIEDGICTAEELSALFGPRVTGWVQELSKDPGLPKAQRERQYVAQLRKASRTARVLKLADMYDNLCDASTGGNPKQTWQKVQRYREALAQAPSIQQALARFDKRVQALRAN